MSRFPILVVGILVLLPPRADGIVIGGKAFAESYILAEVAARLLEHHGHTVERRQGLNGTKIAFEGLRTRAIDVYPEYTGTISEVILQKPDLRDLESIIEALAELNLELLPPLGFDNSYALAVTRRLAETLDVTRISDLRSHPELRVALPHEFLSRSDGWNGLKETYGLSQAARGIEHSLAYQAIESAQVDVIAVYTTDGEIIRSDLVVLDDDFGYFPTYLAAFLTHKELPREVRDLLARLSGRIDNDRMRQMNLAVLDSSVRIEDVAAAFLDEEDLVSAGHGASPIVAGLWRNTQRHLKLTALALLAAIGIGVGIAMAVHRQRTLSNAFLYFAGLMQTVPSIALLALMIPLVGVGQKPAVIALFLYSLLPIARSTIAAMLAIPPGYRQVAAAMAMTRTQELRYVFLPLAMPHVLAGIRTAAVICIGTATLAAFIGAGGLGDPIVTGLALNDTGLILQGAIPAAILAIGTELLFGMIERILVVPHMRSGRL
ncbi:MAG: ABC transporter permease subunit [Gammaproteobacteria bacterium]|nr:ABC transporter permease subunit [Gammaproteobacteria bacterium]MDH4253667.1 ABC transporter permease subunit [Gammaproteobacteria bacterium]MDH5311665.1 ABC transporter permease subunit [Gammaproteobacteria bacterium]